MLNFTTKDLTINSLIAATYVAITFIFSFMSFGEIQFRVAEVLLILVIFNPKYATGLILGNAVANFLPGSFGIIDVVFGTLASLLSIIGLIIFRKRPLIGLMFPALINGLIVGKILHIMIASLPYYIYIINVSIGQFVVLYFVAYPLYIKLSKREDIIELLK